MKKMIKIQFKEGFMGMYDNVHLEIRLMGTQIRFYEVEKKKEHNLHKDTVRWLIKNGRLSRTKLMKKALKGNKSIFN